MILLKFFLLHYSFMLILGKYSFKGKLLKIGAWLGVRRFGKKIGKFIYDLSECIFCYNHLGGLLAMPLWILINGFCLDFLLFPLMSTGAIFLISKQIDK